MDKTMIAFSVFVTEGGEAEVSFQKRVMADGSWEYTGNDAEDLVTIQIDKETADKLIKMGSDYCA